MKQNTFDECPSFTEMLEKLEYNYAHRKWYVKVWHSIYCFFKHITVDAYWKYLRNWNWCVPTPRGYDSRHGYSDTPELIEGSLFALFVRYYEGEYLTQNWQYTESTLEDYKQHPENYYDISLEEIKSHITFRKRIEWVYDWIKTNYDHHNDIVGIDLDKEDKYQKELQKAMHIIVRYHGWMWT